MMLSQLGPNEMARIVAIEGGRRLHQKLALMGVAEGDFVRLISRMGPITVEVNRNTLSLGRGIASKIRVRRI